MPKIRQAIAVLVAAAGCIVFNTFRYPVVWEMVAAGSAPAKAAEASGAVSRPAAALSAPARPSDRKPADRKAVTASTASSQATDSTSPLEPKDNEVVCKDGVCTMVFPDPPAASLSSSSEAKSESEAARDDALEAKPKPKEPKSKARQKTSGSAQRSGKQPGGASSDRRLDDRTSDNKPGAKLVSNPLESNPWSLATPKPASGETKLIPIQRPRSRSDSAGTPGKDKSAKSQQNDEPGAAARQVRPLPPVDPVSRPSSAVPATEPAPELVRTYPVTSSP